MDSFATYPFARILLPFIAGIIFYDNSDELSPRFIYYGLIVSFLSCIVFIFIRPEKKYNRNIINGISLSAFIFFSATFISYNQDWKRSGNAFHRYLNSERPSFLKIRINDHPLVRTKSVKICADVLMIKTTEWKKTTGNLLLYIQKGEQSCRLKYGDELFILADPQSIKPPANPGEMDYKKFLSTKRIYHSSYVKENQFTRTGNSASLLFEFAYSAGKKLEKKIDSANWTPGNKAIAKALLLGSKEDMDTELTNAFSSTGTMHVLSVSGLHAGLVYLALRKILEYILMGSRLKTLKIVICLCGLWFYALVTGLCPSVTRAATMLSFILIGEWTVRTSGIYNSLAAAAFLMLCSDTQLLYGAGFQLSFIAVWGIVYFQQGIYNQLFFSKKTPDTVWKLTSVTISAQLATFPLGLYYFHSFPVWFLVSNLVIIPLATIVLYSGLVFLLVCEIPYLSTAAEFVTGYMFYLMEKSTLLFSSLPVTQLYYSINFPELVMIFCTIIFLGACFPGRKIRFINYSLFFLLFFFLLRLSDTIKNNSAENKLVLFSHKEQLIAGFYHYPYCTIFSLGSSPEDRIKNSITNESLNSHYKKTDFISIDSSFTGKKFRNSFVYFHYPYFSIENKRFIILQNDSLLSGKPISLDYVIVHNASFLKMEEVSRKYPQAGIIFTAGNKFYRIKKWEKEAGNNFIWNIAENGSLTIQLKSI